MTIAAVYVSAEGVVFGADSTTTFVDPTTGKWHYNHAQKIFEIGEDSTVAAVTWGLGGLNVSSYRTLFALLSDSFRNKKPRSVLDVCRAWCEQFWTAYSTSPFLKPIFAEIAILRGKSPNNPTLPTIPIDMRTRAEEDRVSRIKQDMTASFCIGGYMLPDRTPRAFAMLFDPFLDKPPTPEDVAIGPRFWGVPHITQRVQFGCDDEFKEALFRSGKWNGTEAEIEAFVAPFKLKLPILPVRDAIDFVHINIITTIKALKFSSIDKVCGGPVELGVITSDRSYRWVKHKSWTSAIEEVSNERVWN